MRVVYVYAFAGVSSPMLLGALLDAGAPFSAVQEVWHHLQLPPVSVALERVHLADHTATRLVWEAMPDTSFLSSYTDATLGETIKQRLPSPKAAQRLIGLLTHFAGAVSTVYGQDGRDFTLQSTTMLMLLYLGSGVVAALEALAVEQLLAAPVNLGAELSPLTAALLQGALIHGERTHHELTTVDGAAILTSLAADFGPLPMMRLLGRGYGASAETVGSPARGLQVLLGEMETQAAGDRIAILEANIDDMNPEFYEAVFERLLAHGALDVSLTPLLMKKGRPANKLTVLAPLTAVADLSRMILQETSTFGVRVYEAWRQKLDRFWRQVETRYGSIPVKCGVLDGRIAQAAPEYDACKRAALERGVPVRLVYTEAARLAASWLTESGVQASPEAP